MSISSRAKRQVARSASPKSRKSLPRQKTGFLVQGLDLKGRMGSRLSSRSAMYADLHLLLSEASAVGGVNLRDLILENNLLRKSTTAARQRAFQELNLRYDLGTENSPLLRAFLREWNAALSSTERDLVAYVLFALNDRTAMIASSEWLYPHLRRPASELRVGDLEAFLQSIVRTSHPEVGAWSRGTLARVARHYLASVRDFGLAKGGAKKVSVKPALYAAPVRLLISAAQLAGCTPYQILRHEAFKILGIAPDEVIDALAELHRQRALHFKMQADIVELSL